MATTQYGTWTGGLRPDKTEKLPSLQDYLAAKATGENGTPGTAASSQGDDHTEGEAQVQPDGTEAGTAPCGGGCTDCRCGEPGNTTQPNAAAGGEDADRIRAEGVA